MGREKGRTKRQAKGRGRDRGRNIVCQEKRRHSRSNDLAALSFSPHLLAFFSSWPLENYLSVRPTTKICSSRVRPWIGYLGQNVGGGDDVEEKRHGREVGPIQQHPSSAKIESETSSCWPLLYRNRVTSGQKRSFAALCFGFSTFSCQVDKNW